MRKDKINDLFFEKRKIKKFLQVETQIYDNVPKEIKEQFDIFEQISDKKGFLLSLLLSENEEIVLFSTKKFSNIIDLLETNGEKYPIYLDIFCKEIFETFFSLLTKSIIIPIKVGILIFNLERNIRNFP